MEYGDFSVVKDTQVGEGTVIRGHCNIFGSKIGRDCKIGPMAYLEPGSSMGDRSTLRPGCHIGDGVTIGNDVFVGPGVYTTNDLYPAPLHVPPLKTDICDGAVIGAGAILLPVRIGHKAFVAAGAVVTRGRAGLRRRGRLARENNGQHKGYSLCRKAEDAGRRQGSEGPYVLGTICRAR